MPVHEFMFTVPFTPIASLGRDRNYVTDKAIEALPEGWQGPLKGPVQLDILFEFKPPVKREALLGTDHLENPMLDDLIQVVLAGLDQANVWKNWTQVSRVQAQKRWADNPRTLVKVQWES